MQQLEAHRVGDQWFVEGYEPRQGGAAAGFVVGFVLSVLVMALMAI